MQDIALINYLPLQGEEKIAYKFNKGRVRLFCGVAD